MGSLNLGYIKNDVNNKKGYTFVDIHLDLENDYKKTSNFSKADTQIPDIKIAYDDMAIKNSLISLFNTRKGQRLLRPNYGLDIERYIFTPIGTTAARAIGLEIQQAIENFEPRLNVTTINIRPVESDLRYDISLELFIPALNRPVSFSGSIIRNEGITLN